ncbi:MAG: energy-coupling factor transporter transmembrane component T [Lachnospiraceae bacterium]|nr:energy-coupling factor transporter transmembrane component T [Lachnospiraceae bacterium]
MNLKIMKLLAGLARKDKENHIGQESRGAGPALLLIASICVIFLCALSRNAIFTVTVLALLLLRIALMAEADIVDVLKPVLLPAIFCMLIMLPAVFMGSPRTMLTVTMKVVESVTVLSLLGNRIGWKGMTGAFGEMHLPPMFVMVLDTTMRFLTILGDYSGKIVEAVTLRRVGEKNWKNAGTGGILGQTFLKSQEMSTRMEEALFCRGFSGQYKSLTTHKFGAGDILLIVALIGLFAFFFYTQGMM